MVGSEVGIVAFIVGSRTMFENVAVGDVQRLDIVVDIPVVIAIVVRLGMMGGGSRLCFECGWLLSCLPSVACR